MPCAWKALSPRLLNASTVISYSVPSFNPAHRIWKKHATLYSNRNNRYKYESFMQTHMFIQEHAHLHPPTHTLSLHLKKMLITNYMVKIHGILRNGLWTVLIFTCNSKKCCWWRTNIYVDITSGLCWFETNTKWLIQTSIEAWFPTNSQAIVSSIHKLQIIWWVWFTWKIKRVNEICICYISATATPLKDWKGVPNNFWMSDATCMN